VNQVNAPTLARRQGIKLVEARSDQVSDYRRRLDVALSGGGKSIKVSGTLFDERHPRLVRIQDFDIEAVLDGNLLLTRHEDRPGVTADFCRVIADAGINITRLHLGPVGQEGRAMAVIGLEQSLPSDVLEKMRSIPALEIVRQLSCEGCGP
jgi:D-3-phosphoglycerate dehydrogenase